MKKIPAILILLIACSVSFSQTVTVPRQVVTAPSEPIKVSAQTDTTDVQWYAIDVGLQMVDPAELKDNKTAIVWAKQPGSYRLLCYGAKEGKASAPSICVVLVIGPPNPTPPTPGPPNPPDPTPPQPVPTPLVKDLHILIMFESGDKSKYKPETIAILSGRPMSDFMDSKTPLRSDKIHAWRIWDKNQPVDNEDKVWQTLMQRRPTSTPWIILSHPDGTPAYEGPLPATVEDVKTLINKYTTPQLRKAG